MSWLLLAVAIGTEVIGTLSMKASEGFTRKIWLIPVIVGYGIAFTSLGMILGRGMSVGVVYGIWVSCGVALTAVLGRIIFKESLTWVMGLGIALIIGGVIFVEAGS